MALVLSLVALLAPTQASADAPSNDYFEDATARSSTFWDEVTTTDATMQSREPAPSCAGSVGHSVWYRYDTPDASSLYAATSGSGFDTVLALYEGASLSDLGELDCNDDGGEGNISVLSTTVGPGTHYIQVSGYGSASGDLSFHFEAAPILDDTPPSVDGAVPVVHVPSTLGDGSTKIVWHGWDQKSGIASFQLQRAVSGGTWRNVLLPTDTATSVRLRKALDTDAPVQFRVRATDNAGNRSAWATGPSFTNRVVQDRARAITYSGKWTRASDSRASGDSLTYSTEGGARASLTFQGRAVGFVTSKGPSRGRADILVDGVRRATVDMNASRVKHKAVVFSWPWRSSRIHTIAVVVRGGGARVDLDAFTVYR